MEWVSSLKTRVVHKMPHAATQQLQTELQYAELG